MIDPVRSLMPEQTAARHEAEACGKSVCHVLWRRCAEEDKCDIARPTPTGSAELAHGPSLNHVLVLLRDMAAELSPQGSLPKESGEYCDRRGCALIETMRDGNFGID